MLSGKLIICDSNIPWHHNRYSKHHLMSRLARSNEVVFMDPEEELGAYLRRPRGQRGSLARRTYQPPGEDLTVFTPLWLPGRSRFEPLRRWEEPYLVRQVRSVVRRHPDRELILFLGNAWHVFLLDAFPEAACTLYHCSDNFPAMFEGEFRRRFEEREQEMIRRVDLVVCSHPTLVERCRQYSERVHYLEHAVDERFFRPEGEVPCPADLADIPRPRVGFVGSLDGGIDYDLLYAAAQELPDLSWVLIGPVQPQAAEALAPVCALPNVWHLGPRPWEHLPQYLWNLDVGIIPYRASAMSEARCPLKLYEYLAAGLPVVSTPLEVAGQSGRFVRLAVGPDDFSQMLERALQEGPAERAERVRYAEDDCTWQRRAEDLSEMMAAVREERRTGTRPVECSCAS